MGRAPARDPHAVAVAAPLALVDCNNFYASCERLFQPALRGQPVVVLTVDDLAAGRIGHDYTRELVRGSQGHDPAPARAV